MKADELCKPPTPKPETNAPAPADAASGGEASTHPRQPMPAKAGEARTHPNPPPTANAAHGGEARFAEFRRLSGETN